MLQLKILQAAMKTCCSQNTPKNQRYSLSPKGREGASPVRENDLLHVVGHEEVVEAPALVPLHEGLLGPGRATRKSEKGRRGASWSGEAGAGAGGGRAPATGGAGSLGGSLGSNTWPSDEGQSHQNTK